MYIAMNRFKVETGSEDAFEHVWKTRETSLDKVPGFERFNLLRGPANDDEGYTLYASHTTWASESHFRDWTASQNFRDAHRNTGQNEVLYKGHPQFEGFGVVEGA